MQGNQGQVYGNVAGDRQISGKRGAALWVKGQWVIGLPQRATGPSVGGKALPLESNRPGFKSQLCHWVTLST